MNQQLTLRSFPRKFFFQEVACPGRIIRKRVCNTNPVIYMQNYLTAGEAHLHKGEWYYPNIFQVIGNTLDEIRDKENECAKILIRHCRTDTVEYENTKELLLEAYASVRTPEMSIVIPSKRFNRVLLEKEIEDVFDPCTHLSSIKLGYVGSLKGQIKGYVYLDEDNLFDDIICFDGHALNLLIVQDPYDWSAGSLMEQGIKVLEENIGMYAINFNNIVLGKRTMEKKQSEGNDKKKATVSVGCTTDECECSICKTGKLSKNIKEELLKDYLFDLERARIEEEYEEINRDFNKLILNTDSKDWRIRAEELPLSEEQVIQKMYGELKMQFDAIFSTAQDLCCGITVEIFSSLPDKTKRNLKDLAMSSGCTNLPWWDSK